MSRHATPEDFARWEAQASQMTDEALRYVMNDATAAMLACATHDAVAEGFYADQVHTFGREWYRRRGG